MSRWSLNHWFISSYIFRTYISFQTGPEIPYLESEIILSGSFVKYVWLNKRAGKDINSLATTLGWRSARPCWVCVCVWLFAREHTHAHTYKLWMSFHLDQVCLCMCVCAWVLCMDVCLHLQIVCTGIWTMYKWVLTPDKTVYNYCSANHERG